MKVGLFTKLFLASLLTTTIVVLSMIISVHWTFRHGLEDYLHQKEIEQLNKLIPELEAIYAKLGSWAPMREDPESWRRLLHETFGEEPPPPPPGFPPPPNFPLPPPGLPPEIMALLPLESLALLPPEGARFPIKPRHHHPPMGIMPRVRLLDAQQQPVLDHPPDDHRPPRPPPPEILQPLTYRGETIGWLALRPHDIITDQLALNFQTSQLYNYSLIAILAVLVSALVSLKLVRQLLNPIQHMASGVRALSNGIYRTRVQVSSRDELGQLATDFNHLAHTLERNEQARRQWIADISHELRTPLAILQGEIEALQDGVWSTTPDNLKSLHGEVLGLSKLVDDLYSLALSDLGALDYRKEAVEVVEVLNETVELFSPRLAAKGITYQAVTQQPVAILADARRLTQLFSNLLENSLRYTDSGGHLEIHMHTTKNTVILDFQDSAPGVPNDALDQLFERFYRVDPSRSRALGGAGLGLAICYNIVEAHEGKISAAHSLLGGLAIKIELPRYGIT